MAKRMKRFLTDLPLLEVMRTERYSMLKVAGW